MRHFRLLSQGGFLLLFLFLFLQTESTGNDKLGYPVKLFLDFNPLILLTTFFSAHGVASAFYLSLITIFLTLIFGRFFCGWVCPFGTLHNFFSFFKKRPRLQFQANLFYIKYYLLTFLLISSLFTIQLVGIVDPLSLLIRSLSISIYPLVNLITRAFFNTLYELNIPGVVTVSEHIFSVLKELFLAFGQPIFRQSFLIGFIFIFILLLNVYEKRFWCRYLCPLGALLGFISKFSLLKRSVNKACNECGTCSSVCQANAFPDRREEWKDSECYYCWNCDDICPQNAISFNFSGFKKTGTIDVNRRSLILTGLSAILILPLFRTIPTARADYNNPKLIRPPGSLEEKKFLARCIKCGECMKVCLTNGLQPTIFEAGLEGIWSPILVPELGYCEYNCTLCGQVCPTGAIKTLTKNEKAKVKIGLAMIDKGRCLPWSHGIPCIVCEEVCPTPEKAIWFEKRIVSDKNGNKSSVLQPRVDLKLCIGCGICEAKCPVTSIPAIYVISSGETRSEMNQLLL